MTSDFENSLRKWAKEALENMGIRETPDFEDKFKELEEKVMEDMRRTYSERVIDYFLNPRNLGEIQDPDGFAQVTGPCGDTMEIWLKVQDERISRATFWTDGCGTSIACGSMTTELVKGKTPAEALQIASEEILNDLGGLPEDSIHCSVLAANTLREAVRDYLALKKEPWKKAYRRR